MINVLLVYGEGGHHDQAMRLMQKINGIDPAISFIHITDSETMKPDDVKDVYVLAPLRHKNAPFDVFNSLNTYRMAVALTFRLIRKYRPSAVIGFGPGICVPVFMACKLLGVKKRIFFEDWCRFTTKSLSGKACSPFATRFFIQNESLKELYPYAQFAGRL